MAYSMDLRERVAAACDEGIDTRAEIAERFTVSQSWIRRLLQRRRDTGSLQPKPHRGGHPSAFDAEATQKLRDAVKSNPDATLRELVQATGVACSISAVDRTLRRLRIPWKKVILRRRAGSAGTEGRARGVAKGVCHDRRLAVGLPR